MFYIIPYNFKMSRNFLQKNKKYDIIMKRIKGGVDMEEVTSFETVKEKLITAGIKELEEHGIADFSLRRVASACNVSCAAPYKHFSSKENFIAEIILYIHERWETLREHVAEIFSDDIRKELSEVCIAYIKFWIANPNFRSVLMLRPKDIGDERVTSENHSTGFTKSLVKKYAKAYNLTPEEEQRKAYILQSLVYGAVLMIDNADLDNTHETIEMIKSCILNQF